MNDNHKRGVDYTALLYVIWYAIAGALLAWGLFTALAPGWHGAWQICTLISGVMWFYGSR